MGGKPDWVELGYMVCFPICNVIAVNLWLYSRSSTFVVGVGGREGAMGSFDSSTPIMHYFVLGYT